MKPDLEQSLQPSRTESLMPPTPPLLEGIGRVLVATENKRKLTAVRDLLDRYPIVRGTEILVPEPHRLTGDEPPWENAVAVSRNKVENVVHELQGTFGPKTLVVASDIVVWYNREAYQNLSRLPHMSQEELKLEVCDLQEKFSSGVEAMWDVATSVSRPTSASQPEVQLTLADRHIATFSPISPDAIAAAFWSDVPGAKTRNSRIQPLEQFPEHVLMIETIPFVKIADQAGNWREGCEWMRGVGKDVCHKDRYIRDILAQVVGGVPVNERLQDLLNFRVSAGGNGSWILI